MQKNDTVSLRMVKHVIKNHLSNGNEISKDVLVLVQNSMSEILDKWIEAALKEFADVNHFRELQGIKKLRRLDVNVFKTTKQKLFISENNHISQRDRTEVNAELSCDKADIEVV